MNFHAALVEVADGKVTSNASGHHVAKILKKYYMIPGGKGHKSDAGLPARGFLTLDPAKNMNKQPFFAENERIMNVFEYCESTKCGTIRYQRGQKTFDPNIIIF